MKLNYIILLAGLLGLGNTSAQALEVGDIAPCVVLDHIAADGSQSEHCIRDHADSVKYTVIEFFSATCSDCQTNLPIFSRVAADNSSKATFRLVGIDRSEALLRNYIATNRSLIQFETALDTNRFARVAYEVSVVPTTFVLDPDNRIVFKHTDVLSDADVAELTKVLNSGI